MFSLYENIKNRRIALKLTQDELAKRTGYSDISMIAKIEKGQVDLPQSKIVTFASALGVSPACLMGWENPSPAADQPDHSVVGAAKPELSDRAYMVGRAYDDADYLTQRMVERTLGIEEEAELKEPAGRQAFTA